MVSRRMLRRLILPAALLFAVGGFLLSASPSNAHAIIVSSSPAANSRVPEGAVDILLQYNSRIDISHSRVSLVDPSGKVTALKAADGAAPGSLATQGSTDSLGKWIIRWQVLSTDGHITRGEIPFQVIVKTAP